MDIMLLLKALVLGVVEGLTEFLPISSTGHLILVGDLLDFNDQKGLVFEIVIQTGAMLAILVEYRKRFTGVLLGLGSDPKARSFVINLIVAFLPAAVLGLAFNSVIKAALFKPVPVAIAFMIAMAVVFAALGVAIGSSLQDMQGFQLIMNFLVMPIFFLSGALYPLNNLPTLLSVVTKLDPLAYGVDGLRTTLIGVSHFGLVMDATVLLVALALLLVVGSRLFDRIQV